VQPLASKTSPCVRRIGADFRVIASPQGHSRPERFDSLNTTLAGRLARGRPLGARSSGRAVHARSPGVPEDRATPGARSARTAWRSRPTSERPALCQMLAYEPLPSAPNRARDLGRIRPRPILDLARAVDHLAAVEYERWDLVIARHTGDLAPAAEQAIGPVAAKGLGDPRMMPSGVESLGRTSASVSLGRPKSSVTDVKGHGREA
jgi:hypothetical protein